MRSQGSQNAKLPGYTVAGARDARFRVPIRRKAFHPLIICSPYFCSPYLHSALRADCVLNRSQSHTHNAQAVARHTTPCTHAHARAPHTPRRIRPSLEPRAISSRRVIYCTARMSPHTHCAPSRSGTPLAWMEPSFASYACGIGALPSCRRDNLPSDGLELLEIDHPVIVGVELLPCEISNARMSVTFLRCGSGSECWALSSSGRGAPP